MANLKAQIHIAKSQLNMDDDTYRALLKSATGKTSCADMGIIDLNKALQAFKDRGFKSTKPRPGKKALSPKSKGTRVDKMRAVWITMQQRGLISDGSETALLHWVQGQLKKRGAAPIDSLQWLDGHAECNQLLEQLKQWSQRKPKQEQK
jgi:phage gp16-like protein